MHDQDLNAIKSKYSFSNALEQFVFKLTSKYHTGIKLKYNVLDIKTHMLPRKNLCLKVYATNGIFLEYQSTTVFLHSSLHMQV